MLIPAVLFAQDQPVHTESASARAHFIQGMKSFDASRFDDARMHWDAAIAADPEFAAPQLYRTWVATSGADWSAHTDNAVARRENASGFIQNLIDQNVAGTENDAERTLELSLELVAMNPTSARAYHYLGFEYASHKMYEAERGALRTAMALDPGYAPAYKTMSNSYIFNEPTDLEKGKKYAKKYLKLTADEADAYIQYGDAHRAMSDFAAARDAYSNAIAIDADHATAPSKRGHANTYLGDYDAARADFAAAAGISRTLGAKTAQQQFGMFTHLYAGDAAAAMEANAEIIEGLKMDEADDAAKTFPLRGAYNQRAQIAMHHGMFDEAEDALKERATYTEMAIEQVGRDEWAANQRANEALLWGQLAAHEGDFKKARKYAEEAKELVMDQSNARRFEGYHRVLGLIDLKDGNGESAAAHLAQANDQNPLVKYELAEAYEAAGDTEMAMKLYEEVANYNFNALGTAICRGMAKEKIAM